MDFYSFAPVSAALDVAYGIVTALASFITPLVGTSSAAVAVVLITVMVRTALIPVGVSQVRAEFTRRRLAPQLQALQRKYKKNPELLQRKTMEFYKSENASPLAGCLPALVQLPVVSVVYALFIRDTIAGHPNALLSEQLAGVPLGMSMIGSGFAWPSLLVFVILLTVIACVSWGSRVISLRFASGSTEEIPQAMQRATSALSWMPFVTVVFGAVVPLAATLYLTVTTAWTLVERVVLRRLLAPKVTQ